LNNHPTSLPKPQVTPKTCMQLQRLKKPHLIFSVESTQYVLTSLFIIDHTAIYIKCTEQ